MKTLIKNTNIITPYEINRNSSLLIKDGKIAGIFNEEIPTGTLYDEIIDGQGNYVSPGFIDIHTHGNLGYDTMEASFESLDIMGDFHIKNGVTSYLPTVMTENMNKIKKAVESIGYYINNNDKNRISSQVLGVYLEGPYFSMEKKGAQPPKYIKNPNLDEIKELIKLSKDTIKVVAIAPELQGARAVIEYLKAKGITISAAHTNATYDEARAGIDLGITHATHLYNGMRNYSHREPGVVGAVLIDERVACEMICDGIHLHPGAMMLAVKMKGKDSIILISDAIMATGLKYGKYEQGGRSVFVKDGVARLEDGTLAGSTLTLNKAVYNMVNMVNVSLVDAVRMASLNPAKAIGVSDKKGSIEIGKDADLIIFDKKLDILKVMIKGKLEVSHG